jgi:DNA repair exonuclease SbcCD ATPase subunit
VRLVAIHVDGFGKLVDRHLTFERSFNVIVGENEAGKSTLSAAILALLYGLGRGDKERFRPWTGSRYAARLVYELADGRTFEIQRDFDRDSKGIRVYDEHGNDASGACAVGKAIVPGEAHLGLPVEVFTNASYVAQGSATIDGSRAERITSSLARALDGGPREDAALGALGRLDDAIAEHVGRKRATVNAPLRHLQEEIEETHARAADVRERLRALDDLRARLEAERARAADLEAAVRRHEAEGRALRAYMLRSRLDALRDVRDDLSALSAQRADYDDVDGFPERMVVELDTLYREWQNAATLARAQADEAQRGRMTPALMAELEERNADGGSLDAAAFAELETCAAQATAARDRATVGADRAQAARRSIEGGSELFGALVAAAGLVAGAAIVLTFVNEQLAAIGCACVAFALFVLAGYRWNRRRGSMQRVNETQRAADEATAAEHRAAERVAAVLGPLGISSVEELGRRRARALELGARKAEAARLVETATATQRSADAAAAAFDALAARIVEPSGSRSRDLEAAREREARKRARDGIDVRLSMLDVRRGDVLGDDDEFALEAELAELLAAGIEPQAPAAGRSARSFEAERTDLVRRFADAEKNVVALAAELAANETTIGDVAALDEHVATLRARVRVLERFERAVELARTTIDTRTKEAHQKFARRLSDYASRAFADVTSERYAEVRIDPTTLAVRVRSPENDAIVDVERLSAGTREQTYLVTRLAMAQMFSEGLEAAPLLLDDPFAFWDDARIERVLPILDTFAQNGAQLTIFTTSEALAAAASARGAGIHRFARN